MSWLLELLVDAIREMCSQFIVDMMELITNMFTELLSCNLSLFEELFSVVGSLYKNVIVPTGIAILLMILVWQLFKSMFGGKAGVNAEEPIELICRSAISLFLLAGSKPLVDYILRIAGTPYQWVVGTKVKVASFSGYVSTLEGVTDTLGISSLSISVLMLIMQFVVAWNYFKMLMVIAERYVLLGVFSYTAPLAFATGGSKATNNILASWSKMFGGQVVLVILNAWCMKMFLSGYGNMMASSYGFTKFFAATLCLVGFCKITFKLDSYMASLGVNLGRPAPGMGAAGAMLAASRIISQAARTASGSGGTGDVGGTRTDMGSSDGMTTNFTGPIPMTPNGGNAMDINDMTSDGDFDKESPSGPGNQQNEASPADKTVFEELGMAMGSSDTAEMDFGSGDHVNGNIDSISPSSSNCINIMEIRPADMETRDLLDGYTSERSELASKIQSLHIFFSLLIPDMSHEEKQLLDGAMVTCYQEKGITHDNLSLTDPEHPGKYKKMPILGDLHEVLMRKEECRRMANILNRLVSGSASSFNQQTNVDLENKYVVLDISELSGDLLLGMFVALDFVWTKTKEDRTVEKAVFVDEAWKLLMSNDLAGEYLIEIFKTIRAYGGSAICATQDLADCFAVRDGKLGRGILSNSKTKIVLNMEVSEAERIQEELDLSEAETNSIIHFERGNGLISTNNNNLIVEFKASALEKDLITTDRKDLQELKDRIRKYGTDAYGRK